MPTFNEIKSQADSPSMVRKILEAVAFLGNEDAPEIDTLMGVDGALQAIPPEYMPVGIVSPDGYTFGRDTNVEDVEGLGYASPVRSDITSATRSVSFTALEAFRRILLELVYGIDLSAVSVGANGEITWDHPDRPLQREYKLLIIGRDGGGNREWFRGKWFPRVSVTEFPEEVWSAADPTQYEISMNTYVDETVGTGERDFIAGTGLVASAEALGFAAASGG